MTKVYALPFKIGPKIGVGSTFSDGYDDYGSDVTFVNAALGVAALIPLAEMFQIEANILLQRNSLNVDGSDFKLQLSMDTISIPLIAHYTFSISSSSKLGLGTGFEQRIFSSASGKIESNDGQSFEQKLDSEPDNKMSSYIPISFMAMFGNVGLELRYSKQISTWMKNGASEDDLMFFGSYLF